MIQFVQRDQIYEARFRHFIYIAKFQHTALYSIDCAQEVALIIFNAFDLQ